MRKAVIALAALAALAAPQATRANEGAEGGERFKLGVGLGYSIPFGDAFKKAGPGGSTQTEALSDVYSGEAPVELELTYKLTHAISAGVYGGYGYGLVASKSNDVIGSISSWRFGVQGEYEFAKVGPAIPFAALRVGYVTETLGGKNGFGSASASGWEYFTLIGGADFDVAKGLAVGPFVSFAVGQYTTAKEAKDPVTGEGGESKSIPSGDRTLHEWLTIGVRGSFGF
jgi:hypothetical protein